MTLRVRVAVPFQTVPFRSNHRTYRGRQQQRSSVRSSQQRSPSAVAAVVWRCPHWLTLLLPHL